MLTGKKIIVGVTGSIAAYKSAVLVRLLVRAGAEVKVVMTDAAKDFITPLTLATLSKNPVVADFVKNEAGEWNNHVDMGLWADALVIAPASANTLAAMANGTCDNLLLAVYLSARCNTFVAPAMDLDMFRHPSTQKNLEVLRSIGKEIIPPGNGELASGLTGEGRMAEPEEIVSFLSGYFSRSLPLLGIRALVTAGPTYEPIDPVRFIGNHSSGKMGFAIAEKLAAAGAGVTLITGPTSLPTPQTGTIRRIDITTADELFAASVKEFPGCQVAVLSAAVADFKPATVAKEKIKKNRSSSSIELIPTPDTLAELGRMKGPGQLLVGFALETENEVENAQKKLQGKNLDMIVLNSLRDEGAGFRSDTNRITLMDRRNNSITFELKPKAEVADDIVAAIIRYRQEP